MYIYKYKYTQINNIYVNTSRDNNCGISISSTKYKREKEKLIITRDGWQIIVSEHVSKEKDSKNRVELE